MRPIFTALLILLLVACGCENRRPVGALPDGKPLPAPRQFQPGNSGGGSGNSGVDPSQFQLLEVAGLTMVLPASWQRDPVESQMRAAQFTIPAAANAGPGEMVVFHFGAGQGGPAAANLDRWLNQLKDAHDVDRAEATVNGLKFSLIRGNGTWAPGAMGPNAPAPPPLENAGLIGVVIENGPEGTVFVRMTGPRATVAECGPALDLLIRATRRSDDADAGMPQTQPTSGGNGSTLNAAGVELQIPAGWQSEPPISNMRLAQFVVRAADGGANGEVVIYHFGADQGGSASDNLTRWLGQLTNAHDVERDAKSVNGLAVSILRAHGGYAPSPMPGIPATDPIPDAGLVGVVVEGGPQGTVFIKFTGPRATVDANRGAIDDLIASLRPVR